MKLEQCHCHIYSKQWYQFHTVKDLYHLLHHRSTFFIENGYFITLGSFLIGRNIDIQEKRWSDCKVFGSNF